MVSATGATSAIHAADEDGFFSIARLGERMEACYQEAGATLRIASCHMPGRQLGAIERSNDPCGAAVRRGPGRGGGIGICRHWP